MVESTLCPKCSSPILSGGSFCAKCGAPVSGAVVDETKQDAPPETPAEAVDQPPAGPDAPPRGLRGAARADPRIVKLGLDVNPAAAADKSGESPPNEPVAPPVHMPGNWQVDLRSMAERPDAPDPPVSDPEPDPGGQQTTHIPGGYLAPSATYRGSGSPPPPRSQAPSPGQSPNPSLGPSIGAVPITSAATAPPLVAASQAPEPAAAVAPAVTERPATMTATPPARKESAQELVAFGLVAAGGVVGIASLFLPWAGSTGIGIGTVASAGAPPQSNQWAWGMPAAIPLLVLTGLLLGAAAGSDRAQQQLPTLASAIARVTDVILPMILAGLYFGVGLLYVTLPPQFGFGTGIVVLIGAGCLLLAGSIVALFLPPQGNQTPG
ncbi:MAG: hypothetical protein ACXWN4_02080 [Candidatus Limnocylindrales bacterium]